MSGNLSSPAAGMPDGSPRPPTAASLVSRASYEMPHAAAPSAPSVSPSAPAPSPAQQAIPAPVVPPPVVPAPAGVGRPAVRPRGGRWESVWAYVALTKPRIIELLLITTVPSMMLAADGWPGWPLVANTLIGGSLAAGSANVLNCYVDRDIDSLMRRTSRRATARGTLPPGRVLAFGLVLGVLALVWLGLTTTPLATVLALLAILGYVGGYTLGLKRRTPSNIVWGGAAGCLPTLIGWAAVTGSLAWPAWVLFMVVFLWTPPHFWALAIKFRDDYARAGVPMLPVVASLETVGRRIVAYSWAMVAVSLLLAPVTTPVYPLVALVAGGTFLREAHGIDRRIRAGLDPRPMRLFHWSITYLTILFVAVGVDVLLPL